MSRTLLSSVIIASSLLFIGTNASAEEIEVKMLNKGSDGTMMVFEPALIRANIGDIVTFTPTDKSHNAETIRGMIPDGAKGFKGRVNEQVSYEITHEGVVGVKCLPHYGMGMVALIVAGDPVNLVDAQNARQIGKAKQRFADLFEAASTETE